MIQPLRIVPIVGAVCLLAITLSGCAGGESSVSISLSSTTSFEDEEMVKTEPSWGLSTSATASNVGDVCRNASLSGQQLTVKDADGKTVGVVTLTVPEAKDVDGNLVANSAYGDDQHWGRVVIFATATCVTAASVEVSGDSDFYTVTVSGIPGDQSFGKEDLRDGIALDY